MRIGIVYEIDFPRFKAYLDGKGYFDADAELPSQVLPQQKSFAH
jgi:hypothetical protein